MTNLKLKVNTVDKTNQIRWDTLKKRSVLTKQPDILTFSLRNYDSKTWKPSIGDDVQLLDGSTKIFGGVVVETNDILEGGLLKEFTVTCKDYTQLLDRQLVSKNYTSMTAAAIVNDIISTYTTGFTTTNVVGSTVIPAITFNYMSVSQSIQKLCEMIGTYDWFVDYDKDIHFFQVGTKVAPFSLDDTSGNFVYESLVSSVDNTQIRNFITIRGGITQGTAVDDKQVADGQQRIFFVGYNLSSFLAYKALAATPTTFVALTVGSDGIDNPTSVDCLYNPDQGLLIFPDATKPAINDVIKYTGTPNFPLISQVQDLVSIGNNGTYQYIIVDKTITSKSAAAQRGQAELIQYGNPITTINFKTYSSGLSVGQTIDVNLALRGISGTFKISKIDMRLKTPSQVTSDYVFTVEAKTALSVNMVDLLNKLLVKNVSDQISIATNEVVDRIYSPLETISIVESIVVSKSSHPNPETITISESFVNTGKNYGTKFVAGPQTPSGVNRVFVLDGSRLG